MRERERERFKVNYLVVGVVRDTYYGNYSPSMATVTIEFLDQDQINCATEKPPQKSPSTEGKSENGRGERKKYNTIIIRDEDIDPSEGVDRECLGRLGL